MQFVAFCNILVRHSWLRIAQSGLAAVIAVTLVPALVAGESYRLQATQSVGSHQQAKVVVQVEGELKLNADGSEVKRLPIKVDAELLYVERTLATSGGFTHVRTVRSYEEAKATFKLKTTELTNTLRDDRRLIVAATDDKQATTFSPLGPLTREEIDLVEVPGSSLSLAALLPEKAVEIGHTWEHADWVMARLFNLEAVNQHDVVSKLTDVKDQVAIIAFEGKVAGAVGGVSSDIELKGKLNFDLKKQAVTWLALAYKESRAIGHAQPGFEVIAQVRMISSPIAASDQVNDAALGSLPITPAAGTTLVELTTEQAGYELLHDRRWRVMVDRRDTTVMRLVDRGDLVAQCNISNRPPLPKGEQLTLEGFQNDVKSSLGKNFGQVVEASQEVTEAGIRILRVTVSGATGELPIQWTYYHLSDDHGHRASLVFTIEGNLVPRFAQIDRELISGFRFLADKQPTPAAPIGPELKSVEKPGETEKR